MSFRRSAIDDAGGFLSGFGQVAEGMLSATTRSSASVSESGIDDGEINFPEGRRSPP